MSDAPMTNPQGDTWTATIPGVIINAPGIGRHFGQC